VNEIVTMIREGLELFSRRGKMVITLSAISLIALSAIDALALYLLASAFQFSSEAESQGVLVNATAPKLVLTISLFAARSILSTAVTWITTRQLAREQARIGAQNFQLLLNPNIRTIATAESRETQYFHSVDRGPEILTMMMMNSATMLSEVVSIAIILGVFLFFDPLTAVITLFYFCSVVLVQHRVLSRRSALQGSRVQEARTGVYQSLVDASKLHAALTDKSRLSITLKLTKSLTGLTHASALSQVYSSIPRYLLELTFAIGLGVMGLTSLLISGPTVALGSLVLFAGISFRLLPIVNRVQGLALTIIAHAPLAKPALVESFQKQIANLQTLDDPELVFRLIDVSFQYPVLEPTNVLSQVSLDIEKGKQYAIVGPSGSGKSTLASLLLGIESPTEGLLQRNPMYRSAFVPQDTHLAFLPLAENVSLLWDRETIDLQLVERSLKLAGLDHFVNRIADTTPLSDDDVSGGEKQRIGLARSFYSGANLIIFDEVTSSLDAVTESGIVETLYGLRGAITTVIIAHRLSTVQHADKVFYLESGHLLGAGTFAGLAANIPKLRQQIELGRIQLLN